MPIRLKHQYKVRPPNRRTETPVPYYAYVASLLRRQWGWCPSRTTLSKWLNGEGYPIERGGPYVVLPVYRAGKKPMTTAEAMSRWLTVVRNVAKQMGKI